MSRKWAAIATEDARPRPGVERHISPPRTVVYRALLDPTTVAQWKVPDGMTCRVHYFDAREGGSFRITITLADDNGGSHLVAEHEGLARGVPPVDNEVGWRMALGKPAALVERDAITRS